MKIRGMLCNIAEAVGTRIEQVINRIARSPFSAPGLYDTPGRANGARSSLSLQDFL
jgi:hypothetical protein